MRQSVREREAHSTQEEMTVWTVCEGGVGSRHIPGGGQLAGGTAEKKAREREAEKIE